jgi:hypothetical protein
VLVIYSFIYLLPFSYLAARTSMLGDALREKISRITGNLGGNIDRNSFTISEDGANLDSSRRQSNPNAPGNVRPVAGIKIQILVL